MQVSNDYRFRLDVLKRLLSQHFREKVNLAYLILLTSALIKRLNGTLHVYSLQRQKQHWTYLFFHNLNVEYLIVFLRYVIKYILLFMMPMDGLDKVIFSKRGHNCLHCLIGSLKFYKSLLACCHEKRN